MRGIVLLINSMSNKSAGFRRWISGDRRITRRDVAVDVGGIRPADRSAGRIFQAGGSTATCHDNPKGWHGRTRDERPAAGEAEARPAGMGGQEGSTGS